MIESLPGLKTERSILYLSSDIQIFMGIKTISIRDDVYELLKESMRENEDFSDVIGRLLKKEKPNLSIFFGALKNSELLDEIEEDSKKIRASARSRI